MPPRPGNKALSRGHGVMAVNNPSKKALFLGGVGGSGIGGHP